VPDPAPIDDSCLAGLAELLLQLADGATRAAAETTTAQPPPGARTARGSARKKPCKMRGNGDAPASASRPPVDETGGP
jgi:hypothetical protein